MDYLEELWFRKEKKRTPPEPIPGSQPSNTIILPSDDSQKLSVEKSKRVAKSDVGSKSSGLRPSSPKTREMTQGRKRAALTHQDTQAPLKRRKYIAAPDSDSENEALFVQLQKLKPTVGMKSSHGHTPDLQGSKQKKRRTLIKAKDIIDTTVSTEPIVAKPATPSNPDA